MSTPAIGSFNPVFPSNTFMQVDLQTNSRVVEAAEGILTRLSPKVLSRVISYLPPQSALSAFCNRKLYKIVEQVKIDAINSGENPEMFNVNGQFLLKNQNEITFFDSVYFPQFSLKTIPRFPKLQRLRVDLDAQQISGVGWTILIPLLERLQGNTELVEIAFESIIIGDEEAAAMAELVNNLPKLKIFKLKFCEFKSLNSLGVILEILKTRVQLEDLTLENITTHEEGNIGTEVANRIASLLESLPQLKRLSLANEMGESGLAIGTEGVEAIASKLGNLRFLDLSGNKIDIYSPAMSILGLASRQLVLRFDGFELIPHQLSDENRIEDNSVGGLNNSEHS